MHRQQSVIICKISAWLDNQFSHKSNMYIYKTSIVSSEAVSELDLGRNIYCPLPLPLWAKTQIHCVNQEHQTPGAVSIRKTVLPGMAIPMLKIRRPNGRLIFNMGIPIPGKDGLYIETGPWYHEFRCADGYVSLPKALCDGFMQHISKETHPIALGLPLGDRK